MSDALSSPIQPEVQEPGRLAPPNNSQPFLRLYLPEMSVLLPVRQVAEVLNIASPQIVPLPHLPAWVMGVYNWRGEILWMVDLGHLCGLTPWYQQSNRSSNHAAAILQVKQHKPLAYGTKSQTLGLVVNQVGELEWCNPEFIQSVPPTTLSPELAALLHGYWWQADGDVLAVLNGEAILEVMPKRYVEAG